MQSAIGIIAAGVLTALAAADTTVTFSSGTEGWTGVGSITPAGGNPGACFQTVFNNFGIEYRTETNVAFLGDYSAFGAVTLGVDLKVNDIAFFGSPVSRPWLVELRDYDLAQGGYPYASVWFKFDDVTAAEHGNWTHFEVTIEDTTAAALPSGWGGTGAESKSFEPILPPGVTFADVLAGIDEVVFGTYEPGFAFGFTDFDVRIDNISISTSGGCPTDVDGSGGTDVDDLVSVIVNWGVCVGCPEDLNGDNRVDVDDLVEVILGWGECPE